MAEEPKTFQPRWDERKEKHRHHHHHHSPGRNSDNRTNTWGGWMKLHDKQAYYGLMLIVLGIVGYGAYQLTMMFVEEWRAMPHDDPETEMQVDELRIRKVDEQEALLVGDSIAQELNVDSIRHRVQIDTRPVYRPPKKEDKWYITQREWRAIWKDVQRWKYERQLERERKREAREARKRAKEEERRARKQKKE